MLIDLTVPQLGESISEGTLSKWLVREGDVVQKGQALVSIGTDKADSERPCPAAGRGGGFVPPIPGLGYGAFEVPPYRQHEGDNVVPFTRRRRITADVAAPLRRVRLGLPTATPWYLGSDPPQMLRRAAPRKSLIPFRGGRGMRFA